MYHWLTIARLRSKHKSLKIIWNLIFDFLQHYFDKMTFHLDPERHKDYTNERDKLRVQENGSMDRFIHRKLTESWYKMKQGRSGDPSKGVRRKDKVIFHAKSCLGNFLFDKDWIHFIHRQKILSMLVTYVITIQHCHHKNIDCDQYQVELG